MLEQVKYINHRNEVFEFGKNGVFVDENELHNFDWKPTKQNDKITGFSTGIVKRKIPVKIISGSDAAGLKARNALYEVAEKDVLAMQYGKIYVGDYYMRCFVTTSKKKDYLTTRRYMKADITVQTDFPSWVKESRYEYRKLGAPGSESSGGAFLDYDMDYDMDYSSEFANAILYNGGVSAANFRLVIYGGCVDPVIYISGHTYALTCTVGTNEYIVIDSSDKTITRHKVDGSTANEFNTRNRESYIFEKIPTGNNPITWNGDFGVDIILLEERSEPKWI